MEKQQRALFSRHAAVVDVRIIRYIRQILNTVYHSEGNEMRLVSGLTGGAHGAPPGSYLVLRGRLWRGWLGKETARVRRLYVGALRIPV